MKEVSNNPTPIKKPHWAWYNMLIISSFIVVFAVIFYSEVSMTKVDGKSAIEWIHWRAADENPAAFKEAVRILGPDLWDYLEGELSLQDKILERWWRLVCSQFPKRVLKRPKSIEERKVNALMVLERLQSIPDHMQVPLISIIEDNQNLDLVRYSAIQILDECVEELAATTIESIQSNLKTFHQPDLQFATWCLLLKRGVNPNVSEKEMVGLVPLLTSISGSNIRWLISQSDLNVVSFWTEILIRNDNTSLHLFTPRQLSTVVDHDRKVRLLIAGLDICEELSDLSQNQILSAVSSNWDLFDRKTVDQRIIPMYLKKLKSKHQHLSLIALRALVHFDAPQGIVLPAIKEAKATHLHPEIFEPYIQSFETQK